MNSYLKRNGQSVEDLCTDLSDGHKLASLLETISGDRVGKLNKKCRMDIQKLENLNQCLKFLKEHEIKLVNVGSRDILKGNEKIVLGMMWTIILRFEINDADGKAGLLLWCQRSTKGYAGVDITNFTNSWNTGLAFCAIINRYRPDLLEYDGLSKLNALENLEKAFKVAEEKLGITRFLDPEDVADVPRPDEKSIIAYVSQFFKLFAGAHKKDALVKSIERAVDVSRQHDRLADDYTVKGTALAALIKERTAALQQSNDDDSTAKVKEAHSGFNKYVNEERPTLLTKRVELEGAFNVLRSSKRNNNRPEFVPPEEISPEGIGAAWAGLEEAEQAHERALIDKYTRFQKVDLAASRFSNKASTVEEWLNERVSMFQGGEHGNSVHECKTKLFAQGRYETRLEQYKELVVALHAFADVVAAEGGGEHADEASVSARKASVDALLAQVIELGVAYKVSLEAALAREVDLQDKLVKFEANLEELDFMLDLAESTLVEPVEGATVEQVKRMATLELAALGVKLTDIGTMLGETRALGAAVESKRSDAGTQVESLAARLAKAGEAVEARESLLNGMLEAESAKDTLKKQFAEAANSLDSFTSEQEAALGASTSAGDGVEAQIAAVAAVETTCAREGAATRLPGLEALSKECDAKGVVDNPYTRHTVHSIKAMWLALMSSIKDVNTALAAQLTAQQSAEVSPELLAELREVHMACDADKDSLLNLVELKNACQGGGIDLEDEEVEAALKIKSPKRLALDVEQFVEFALEQIKSGDSEEDVLNAFTSLSGGSVISPELIKMHFPEPELQAYLTKNIKGGDHGAFTKSLFTR